MSKVTLPLLFTLFTITAKGQLIFNFQYGKGISFSQRAGGSNDNGNLKLYPYLDDTYSVGAGYKLNSKLALLFSFTLNTHSWMVKMRPESESGYTNLPPAHLLRYEKAQFVKEYKLSALYSVFSVNRTKINITGGVGAYCPRCIFYSPHWSGLPTPYQSSNGLWNYPKEYVIVRKENMKNYTFINTFISVGVEGSYTNKNHEFGIFADFEIAFGKNFDHRVEFVRGSESGHIDIRNRGMLLRTGLFYRPLINLKKKPVTESLLQQ